jgi:hypothetical protein
VPSEFGFAAYPRQEVVIPEELEVEVVEDEVEEVGVSQVEEALVGSEDEDSLELATSPIEKSGVFPTDKAKV